MFFRSGILSGSVSGVSILIVGVFGRCAMSKKSVVLVVALVIITMVLVGGCSLPMKASPVSLVPASPPQPQTVSSSQNVGTAMSVSSPITHKMKRGPGSAVRFEGKDSTTPSEPNLPKIVPMGSDPVVKPTPRDYYRVEGSSKLGSPTGEHAEYIVYLERKLNPGEWLSIQVWVTVKDPSSPNGRSGEERILAKEDFWFGSIKGLTLPPDQENGLYDGKKKWTRWIARPESFIIDGDADNK
ncbi:MAG: hypothetical protein Q8N88_01250 [Nanoarchaeota archaeon]|nr:hypothetical protein [Nanoarchaeota archaeon]